LLPKAKETNFFSDDNRYLLGIEWYLGQFPKRPQVSKVGEVNPQYMFYPVAAERIKLVTPDAKFVFVLRDPLERAYSHYLMSVRRGVEELDFATALETEPNRLKSQANDFSLEHHSYLARSLYAGQIKQFKDVFPNNEFLFLKFDELFLREGRATLEVLSRFLGLGIPSAWHLPKQHAASKVRFKFVRELVHKSGSFKKAARMVVPSKALRQVIRSAIDRVNQVQIEKDERWRESIPQWVFQKLRRDLEGVEMLTCLDLSDWMSGLVE